MGILDRFLNQTAVYWANPVKDGYGGFTYDYPVEISCRWEDKRERVENEKGNEVIARAIVYSKNSYEVGEYLYLGTLNDMDSDSHPSDSNISGSARRIIIRS
ncbi:MAG: hypothetical protein ACOCWM_06300, partial [Cyclobacteriaceae bacterium]